MSKRDAYHDAVREALERAGWVITHDPLRILFEERAVKADLGASGAIGASQGERTIAVEIKDLKGYSLMGPFYSAVGQYLVYRCWLNRTEPNRTLYLATSDALQGFFAERATQVVLQEYDIRLLFVNIERREVVAWNN